MAEWRNTDVGRRAAGGRGPGRGAPSPTSAVRAPGAEELKRIVQVAEELQMDPQVVRIALEREDGGIRTDVSLRDSIRAVEQALGSSVRVTPRRRPRP